MRTDRRIYTHDLVPTHALSPIDRDALWELYRRHYAADRGALDASLRRADLVVRIRQRTTGAYRGMLAFSLRKNQHLGRAFHLVWIGAVALDRECRGKWLIERAALQVFLKFWLQSPRTPMFFIGETCAFQSYRTLARSFQEYWPHPALPTPAWERSVMDTFASQHAGASWDPTRRVIRPVGKHIRQDSARTTADPADPHWRLFHSQNAGASSGEAMIFFAPIHRRNIFSMLSRGLHSAIRA